MQSAVNMSEEGLKADKTLQAVCKCIQYKCADC